MRCTHAKEQQSREIYLPRTSRGAWVALWGLMLTLGCSAQPKIVAKSAAERVYQEGMMALADEDYLTATERFRAVKTKYLFSPYAALSELRLGDTAFAQTRYYEAIETFRVFIQSRPNHA